MNYRDNANHAKPNSSNQLRKLKPRATKQVVVVRTLAMLPDPAIPRVVINYKNADGSAGCSEVLLAADVVF